MKADIVRYLRSECAKHSLGCIYFPDNDVYCVHRKGRAVVNFTQEQFYHIPKLARSRFFNPLIKVGMNHNLGESYKSQVVINTKQGIKLL